MRLFAMLRSRTLTTDIYIIMFDLSQISYFRQYTDFNQDNSIPGLISSTESPELQMFAHG